MKKPLPLWQIWLIAAAVIYALSAVNSDDFAPTHALVATRNT